MSIRVILWLMSSFASASSLLCLLLLSCSRSTNSALSDELASRQRVTVSGSITQDTVWEQAKDYLVVDDVVVAENTVLTLEPDVRIFFKVNPGLSLRQGYWRTGAIRSTGFCLLLSFYLKAERLLYGQPRVRGGECSLILGGFMLWTFLPKLTKTTGLCMNRPCGDHRPFRTGICAC